MSEKDLMLDAISKIEATARYEVIECDSVELLIKQVNKKTRDGWIPIGGVSIALSESDEYQYFVAAQAVVKQNA